MSTTEKKRQALLKKQKKLGIRPLPENGFPQNLRMTNAERDRFTSEFPLELLAVETALSDCFAEQPQLDDLAIAKALKAGIEQQRPADGMEQFVFDRLQTTFETRSGIGYLEIADWRDAQRAILTSVCVVSKLSRGYQGYLNYVTEFIQRTRSSDRSSFTKGLGFRTSKA